MTKEETVSVASVNYRKGHASVLLSNGLEIFFPGTPAVKVFDKVLELFPPQSSVRIALNEEKVTSERMRS